MPANSNPAKMTDPYDLVFIGTGIIPVLEAVHQSACGKSVLMVDCQEDLGGSWLSKELGGVHDIENAIHYLLPDRVAPRFMKEVLKWDVIPSQRKFRVFNIPGIGSFRTQYDSRIGRAAARLLESPGMQGLSAALRELFGQRASKSYYVRGGAPEIIQKIKAILAASNVEVRYSTLIDRIHIDNESGVVQSHAGGETIYSRAIVITHGSKISRMTSNKGPYPIAEKLHPRPAAHLILNDSEHSKIYECIFTADPLVKYAHDVTRFTREARNLVGRTKIVVLALHMDVQKTDDIYVAVLEKLKRAGLASNTATLQSAHWWDVVLPSIDDDDLDRMKLEFGPQVEILKTDNLSLGIGQNAQRWSETIRFPNKQRKPELDCADLVQA